MTEKEEILAVLQTIRAEDNASQSLLFKIRDDITKSNDFNLKVYDKTLCDLILLLSKHSVIHISTINLLYVCMSKGLLKDKSHVKLLHFILDVLQIETQSIENQTRWLKAFDTMLLSENLLKENLKEKCSLIKKTFYIGLKEKITSYQQKEKALYVLSTLLKNADEDIITIFVEEIFDPLTTLMFRSTNRTLQDRAIALGYQLLPQMSNILQTNWDKIFAEFKETYISPMTELVAKSDCVFSKLWTFVTKLFGTRLHRAALMMNPMLTILELAFKSQNFDIRFEAFRCWQALIDNYALDPNELLSPKRIKLLLIPLRTNNCKTVELITVKFKTCCKLISQICDSVEELPEMAKNSLEVFLNFCFGQLNDIPLASTSSSAFLSPGKKFPELHLLSGKALLQLMGQPKYINEKLKESLDVLKLRSPIITQKVFCDMSKLVIFATGECSVLLSEVEDSQLAQKINTAVWKSLFYIIDSCNTDIKKKSLKELTSIILAIFTLTYGRKNLFDFGIKVTLDIIISREFSFFQEPELQELLYLPMLRTPLEKYWDSYDTQYSILCESYFLYIRNERDNFTFIRSLINTQLLSNKTNETQTQLLLLLRMWLAVGKELKNLEGAAILETDNEMSTELLKWPLLHFIANAKNSHAKILKDIKEIWKELYNMITTKPENDIQMKVQISLLNFISKSLEERLKFELIEFFSMVVKSIRTHKCCQGNCDELGDIVTTIKHVIKLPNIPKKAMSELSKCVEHMFSIRKGSTCSKFITVLVDCVEGLLTRAGSISILKHVEDLIKDHDIPVEQNVAFKKLLDVMKKIKDPATNDQINGTLNLLTEKLKVYDTNEVTVVPRSSSPVSKYEKDMEKQKLTLLGFDPTTLTQVQLKGSMLKNLNNEQPSLTPPISVPKNQKTEEKYVLINTPYKFDLKKLPKSQREKLLRRRDDIPALYQDLSQSQSNTVDSNSVSVDTISNNSPPESQDIIAPTPIEEPSVNDTSNQQESDSSEVIVGKENERKRKKLTSLEKELLRIQIDTKDGGEYKNRVTKRRTRSCYGNYPSNSSDQGDSKVLRTKNVSDRRLSQNVKNNNENLDDKEKNPGSEIQGSRIPAASYTFQDMKPGGTIELKTKTGKIEEVKSPKKVNSYKIIQNNDTSTQVSNEAYKETDFAVEEEKAEDAKTPNFIQLNSQDLPPPEPLAEFEQVTITNNSNNMSDNMDTLSISSQIVVEFNETLEHAVTTVNINENVCREVVLDTSTETSKENDVNGRPESPVNRNSIVTSPVNCDTPTRNSELMESTCQISPIKHDQEPLNTNDTAEQVSNVPASSTDNQENSPELFSQGFPGSLNSNTPAPVEEHINKAKDDPPEPVPQPSIKVKKNYLGGRSAQMMNMVSAQPTLINSEPKKTKPVKRRIEKSVFSAPSQNRTKKMMEKLAQNETKEIEKEVTAAATEANEEEFLTFSKELPPPNAIPGPSILKRKCPDADDISQPVAKKRKVNFSDPLVVEEKYIEKTISITLAEKVPRILRSAKNAFHQKENNKTTEEPTAQSPTKNAKESEKELADNNLFSECSADVESNEFSNSEKPACPELINSTESVKNMVADLSGFEFREPWVSVLSARGINTVGQLARLTDTVTKTLKIPLKMSQLRKAFKSYMQRSRDPNKKVRKIKPITLSTKAEPRKDEKESGVSSKRLKFSIHTSRKRNMSRLQMEKPTSAKQVSPVKKSKKHSEAEMELVPCVKDTEILESNARTEVSCIENRPTDVRECTIMGVKVGTFMEELLKTDIDITPLLSGLVARVEPSVLLRLLPMKEVTAFIAKEANVVDILKEFDLEKIYQFFCDFNKSATKCLNMTFLDVMKQLYSVILENPKKDLVVDNLAMVEISSVTVSRGHLLMSTDSFLKRLYGDLYAQKIFKKNLPIEGISENETPTKSEEEVADEMGLALCPYMPKMSEKVSAEVFKAFCRAMPAKQLIQKTENEFKRRLHRKT